MKRWDLDLLSDPTIGDPSDPSARRVLLRFGTEHEGVRFVHELHVHPDDPWRERTLAWPTQARFVCHVLVDQIPERGLRELCESMSTIFDFYANRQATLPLLPTHTTQQGESGKDYTRPEFYFEEE
jgi:hypothetical protein